MDTAIAELPPQPPPLATTGLARPPEVIHIPSSPSTATATAAPRPTGHAAIGVALQVGHRLGIIALLALLGTLAEAYAAKAFWLPLTITAAGADLGLCIAVVLLSCTRRGQPARRETVGLLGFNAALLVVALPLMLLARLDVIRTDVQQRGAAAKADVQEFFSPVPTLPKSTQ